jgi:hypothetical protein
VNYVRDILGPTLLALRTEKIPESSLIPKITQKAVDILQKEIDRPLPPYPDWKRPFPDLKKEQQQGGYSYQSYSLSPGKKGWPEELREFMADPEVSEYIFARVQGERSSIESFIGQHQLDLDCTTITKGRPYRLVCVKNSKSHERALAIRAEETELLERLKERLGAGK